ncbi:RNase H1/viroplasmin domain-containing protein, partial [Candidatus Liberibacter asiaticus]
MNWTNEAETEDLKKIYVVYNGPKPRIYTSLLEASRTIIGFNGVIYRSFTNRI